MPSIEAIQASLQGVLGSAGVVRIAHADAALSGEVVAEAGEAVDGDSAVLSPLEEGDKPEYIQRADEQVPCVCFSMLLASVLAPLATCLWFLLLRAGFGVRKLEYHRRS